MRRGAASRQVLSALRAALREHTPIAPGARVLVAVSGGQDSLALSLALHELTSRGALDASLTLAHCNHGWPGDCASAAHVVSFAASTRLPLLIARGADVRCTEAAAREWRYAALQALARRAGARDVLVAHTRTDLAETALLNLVAGAGADGVGAMRWTRPLGADARLLRPLLDVPREATAAFCSERGVAVWRDPYNERECFKRNRVRSRVMPVLRECANPRVEEALARTAHLLRDDAHALELLACEAFERAVDVDGGRIVVRRDVVRPMHTALQRRVFRRALALVAAPGEHPCSFAHVQALCALLDAPCGARTVSLQGGALAEVDRSDCIVISGGWIGRQGNDQSADDTVVGVVSGSVIAEPVVFVGHESG